MYSVLLTEHGKFYIIKINIATYYLKGDTCPAQCNNLPFYAVLSPNINGTIKSFLNEISVIYVFFLFVQK